MTSNYVTVSIKLYPQAGNDEYIKGLVLSFVSRARGEVFKVRGLVTTSFELVVAGEGGQIWLFSLCGCLKLLDY